MLILQTAYAGTERIEGTESTGSVLPLPSGGGNVFDLLPFHF
jgi:hypothetical protein